jgi:hypothetical protein
VKGPWEDFLSIVCDPYAVYTDKTFPIKRMLLWYNYRPLVASHDLKAVLKNVLFNFVRLKDIDKDYKLWSK